MTETKFKTVREGKGISQSQLAELSGLSTGTIKAYDQGYRPIDEAKFRTLVSLSGALGCRITDILEDKDLIEKAKKTEL